MKIEHKKVNRLDLLTQSGLEIKIGEDIFIMGDQVF